MLVLRSLMRCEQARRSEILSEFVQKRHPLQQTLDRSEALREALILDARLGVPADGDWVSAEELVAEDSPELARRMEFLLGLRGKRDAAMALAGSYARWLAGPAIVSYLLERRAPDLSPANVAVRFSEYGNVDAVAFRRGDFAALPSDPDLAHIDAVILPDEGESLRWLRQSLEDHLAPVIGGVRAITRVGERALWGRCADLCAHAFLAAGREIGTDAGSKAEAFVSAPESPLNGRTRFFAIEHAGREQTCLVSGVCCQGYKVPGYGYCATCPLLSQEELERGAREALAREALA